MQHDIFTPGSIRAIQYAVAIATQMGQLATARDLLIALTANESQASELLERQGVTTETLASGIDATYRTVIDELPIGDGTEHQANGTFDIGRMDELFVETLQEARKRAGMLGGNPEVGTEHLLAGLVAVESDVTPFLFESGLDSEWLAQFEPSIAGTTATPIDADFRLSDVTAPVDETHHVYRTLDAAANRLREGLRVVEDYTRFAMNDRFLSRQLKELRHDLTTALGMILAEHLARSRDTPRDVGTDISTAAEINRISAFDVACANCKRIEESLRTLEEFGKIIEPEFSRVAEQLRYRFYTIEKALLAVHWNLQRLVDSRLYLLVTSDLCDHGFGPAVRESIQGGVDVVQLREKQLSDRRIIEMGKRIREWTRETDTLFIMNDRPDLAVITEADGVHVGQDELSPSEARRIVGPNKFVGVSTHSIEQVEQAVLDGADYIGVGPVFASGTKEFKEFPGMEFVRTVSSRTSLPFFPIGGIDENNIQQVIEAGASRVAVSGAICRAKHPAVVARTLKSKLSG